MAKCAVLLLPSQISPKPPQGELGQCLPPVIVEVDALQNPQPAVQCAEQLRLRPGDDAVHLPLN